MKYTDFGLDETKKAVDKGTTGESFCLWCLKNVGKGFAMCFYNWAICQTCAEEATNIENNHKWELGKCFKCKNPDEVSYRSNPSDMSFSICKSCVDWSKETFNRSERIILLKERTEKMETIEILQKCVVVGNVVKLPDIQLDPKTGYTPVKKHLEAAGGKWNTRTQGFLFEEDPTELLACLQSGKEVNIKKEFQFFPTPSVLAGYLVSLAYNNHLVNISDPRLLEPSAGDGAIVKEIIKRLPEVRVDCFELMELNRIKLQKVPGADIIGNDFLEGVDFDELNLVRGQYDGIIANPPFSKNQDIDHVKAMFKCLKPDGILVSIVSKSWFIGSQKKQTDFKEWLTEMKAHVEEIMPGQFKESGTMVGGMIIVLKNTEVEKSTQVAEAETQEAKAEPHTQQIEEKTFEEPKVILEQIRNINEKIATGLQELETMLNDNPEEMEFFKKLQAVIGQSEINFTVRGKEDNLTVMIMPKKNNNGVDINNVKPLVLNGTAEDMDNGFFDAISTPVQKAVGLVTNLKEFEQSLGDAKTEATKTEGSKPKRSSPKKVETATTGEPIEEAKIDPAEEERLKMEEEEKNRKAEEDRVKSERLKKFNELRASAQTLAESKDFTQAIKTLKNAKEFTDEPDSLNEEIKNLITKKIELEMEEA